LKFGKQIIPLPLFRALQPAYHFLLAHTAAAWYGFPSRKMTVIGVTGTNGKSTVVELLYAVFRGAGKNAAFVSSIRFKINDSEEKNMLKMTMPGRFALQKFLHNAKRAGCKYAVIEVTSEGIKQFRHCGIKFAAAVLTNVTPEHTESHGGFEKYRASKAKLFYRSPIHILNGEDAENINYFSKIPSARRVVYSKKNLPQNFNPKLIGDFNLENIAAAHATAVAFGISDEIIWHALEKFEDVPGRLEFIQREPFAVIVDYAHTPDALRKVYETLRNGACRLICIFGSAGGGRDKWKRPEMGKIATEYCDEIILTNEDPYDENPLTIIKDIESGFSQIQNSKPETLNEPQTKNYKLRTILDRREAIREALKSARVGDTIIITGKGCEPWMMMANGKKIPWDDRAIAREEIAKIELGE